MFTGKAVTGYVVRNGNWTNVGKHDPLKPQVSSYNFFSSACTYVLKIPVGVVISTVASLI